MCSHVHRTLTAGEEDIVGEGASCRMRREGADRVGQCISENVSPLILILMPSVALLRLCRGGERQKEKGNFSIAEAVRQETGERENKSAPVWSLVTTRGKGIVQKDREGGGRGWRRRLGLQRNNVLLQYVPLHSAPACRLTVASLI